jgi:hypothetical protein
MGRVDSEANSLWGDSLVFSGLSVRFFFNFTTNLVKIVEQLIRLVKKFTPLLEFSYLGEITP